MVRSSPRIHGQPKLEAFSTYPLANPEKHAPSSPTVASQAAKFPDDREQLSSATSSSGKLSTHSAISAAH